MGLSSLRKFVIVAFALLLTITSQVQAQSIDVPCDTEALVNAITTAMNCLQDRSSQWASFSLV